MNIAVVDDEEAIREQISGFIKKRNPDFNISGFATGEGLLAAGKEFDILFLPILMGVSYTNLLIPATKVHLGWSVFVV